jgi:hypothetical protein
MAFEKTSPHASQENMITWMREKKHGGLHGREKRFTGVTR